MNAVSVDGMTVDWGYRRPIPPFGALVVLAVDLARILHTDAEAIASLTFRTYSGLSTFWRKIDFRGLFFRHRGFCPNCADERLLSVSAEYYRTDSQGKVLNKLIKTSNCVAWCNCCHMVIDNS